MLGHLLPVLLTSLMHPNLQTLTMADALMPQLVQLVLYTSQVWALCHPGLPRAKPGACSLQNAAQLPPETLPHTRVQSFSTAAKAAGAEC